MENELELPWTPFPFLIIIPRSTNSYYGKKQIRREGTDDRLMELEKRDEERERELLQLCKDLDRTLQKQMMEDNLKKNKN